MIEMLGALVETEKGEGFVVGANTSMETPNYTIRAFDGQLLHGIDVVKLVDINPINHPNIPSGMRDYILRIRPSARQINESAENR